ncbi:MAG TPA: ELWxxDGT repeat protein [Thermoanaerobaculia bacterium]|nr:ELWxxDGT repeat protein [Thermoanaerobaculia bacterium]
MRLPTRLVRAACVAAVLLPPLVASPAAAQPARLLADLSDRAADRQFLERLLPSTIVLDGVAYFQHDDGVTGPELWRSDGTAEGTWRVRDICPGRCWGWVQEITGVGDRLFFLAHDGVHGQELWTSDGTGEGTRLVADLVPGIVGSHPRWITAFGDRVFFSAAEVGHGREPWVSDGTPEGTLRLGDLAPGAASSDPHRTVALDGRLVFFADDVVHGSEPWITDGTPAGTSMLKDIRPGGASSNAALDSPPFFSQSVALGGMAFFGADDGVHGDELWATDGTPSGTVMLADLESGPRSSIPAIFVAAGGRLYFASDGDGVGREIFWTDGEIVELLADFAPGLDSSGAQPIAELAGELLFAAQAGGLGTELWKTDGTVAGTVLVRDLLPGPPGGLDGFAQFWPATVAGGSLYFAADDPALGIELWRTDGTESGTRLVEDVWPGPEWGVFPLFRVARPVDLGGRLFFFPAHPELGTEPWISDGSDAGTSVVRDIFHVTSSAPSVAFLERSVPVDASGRMYFAVRDVEEGVNQAWTSRGTPGSTRRVDLPPTEETSFGYNEPVATLGRRLFGSTHTAADQELWITSEDGAVGSHLATVLQAAGPHASLAGRAYFRVEEEIGWRLWASDGTPSGTGSVADLAVGSAPVAFGDRLFFSAESDEGVELWATDGLPGGTAVFADVEPGPGSSHPLHLTVSGEQLFFAARTEDRGLELWVTDGERTSPLPEVLPGAVSGVIEHPGPPRGSTLLAVPGGVFFLGNEGIGGEEPWWSDGATVAAVGDLRPGPIGSHPARPTAVGDTVFFAADDGSHGRELWRWRPGEEAALVADLVPGPGSSLPQELAAADGVLYFSAFTPERGVELWTSNGTAAGTVPVQDVWPGEESSSPASLTVSGRYLYFTADDGVHGREMWSLLLPTRRPRALLIAGGALSPRGRVLLTLRLENPPPEELPDGDGDELSLPLPPGLRVVELSATSGATTLESSGPAAAVATGPRHAAAAAGGEVVTWNGSLPPGGSVEVTIVVEADAAPPAGLSLQAAGTFDSDGDGSNETSFASDDPSLPGDDDLTVLTFAVAIPGLAPGGALFLALALATAAVRRLRRGAA